MSGILDELNQEQRAAVECTEGPELIIAGAGSGKTRVLTSRIAYLIKEKDVPPERILALTFTKKAAGEMKERIAMMVGERQARRIWMGTFHSVFIRFLRERAEDIGYPSNFTIYDTSDSQNAIKGIIRQMNLDEKQYKPREIFSLISKLKNGGMDSETYLLPENSNLRQYVYDHRIGEFPKIFRQYEKNCRTSGVMDFDDILLYTKKLLEGKVVRKQFEDGTVEDDDCYEARRYDARYSICSRFEHILVDEYQDTNQVQYDILKLLVHWQPEKKNNICVVGDDSQSIYGFRGAQIQNILDFHKDYPTRQLFRLVNNYRSTANIVNAANSLISRNEGRIPKNCVSMGEEGEKIRLVRSYTEQEEAFQIASSIINRMRTTGAAYEDFAILYRTNAQSRALEEQLRRRNMPYIVYSGNAFFDRAEVKDVMAYFKLAVNLRDDESFKRIANKPTRGISDNTLKELSAFAQSRGMSLFEAAENPELELTGLRGAAVKHLKDFCDMMRSFEDDASSGDAYKIAMSIAHESGIWLHYKGGLNPTPEEQSRFENVQELLDSVASFVEQTQEDFKNGLVEDGEYDDVSVIPNDIVPPVTLLNYIENISLLSSVDVSDDETSNKIALMTAHSAKGLEFPYVYVAGMEENLFPSGGWTISARDLEEERRLFYVAITRAKKAVVLTYADTRMRNGRHENNSPSRFLTEIAPQYVENPIRTERSLGGTNPLLGGGGSRFGGGSWRSSDFGSGNFSTSGSRKPGFGDVRASEITTSPKTDAGAGFSRPSWQKPGDKPAPTSASAWEIRSAINSRPKPAEVDPDFVPDPMSSFREGDRIEHNRFGKGTMGPITGAIPDLRAEVSFDLYGKKILLLKHAKLRHIK